VVTAAEIVERIGAVYPLDAMPASSAPAMRYRYADGGGEIGIVASVTQAFCGTCDRVRLTAEGKFRNCLFGLEEYDVRALLRGGASDDEISTCIEQAVLAKWAGHQINQVHFIRPRKSMSQIGG
jgi:cyclic pyranopterin phosphate synthase